MIYKLIKENRSLLGNEKAFSILGKYVPLKYYRIPTGTKCFDWKVPPKWIVKSATLKDLSGNIIIDAKENILHLVNYSNPFSGIVSRSELESHLYVGENDIPYRTAYYNDVWGFCITEEQYLDLNDEKYQVDIQTEFVDSDLILGECFIKGQIDREIILTSYICHPNQANDGLSGVQLLVNLYKKLKRPNKYTYRMFFIPETIGSIALLSERIVKPENVEFAMVVTCVGVGDELNYKKTYLGNHTIDNIVRSFNIKVHEFEPWGSDERQFSSPKIRIPTCSLMRTRWQEFDYYHTSKDTTVSMKKIDELTEIYYQILKKYENEKRYIIKHEGGEPFLSKHNLYRMVGIPGHNKESKIINWVVFLSDGINTISDMVVRSGYKKEEIENVIEILLKKEIIK